MIIQSLFKLQAKRLKINVQGVVQGVGFRPFVYGLATDLALTGWVYNSAQGVTIELEGSVTKIETFLQRFDAELPPLAQVRSRQLEWQEPAGYQKFAIKASTGGQKTALILPETATCPACLSDILDPKNRRYRYPFTNCTHCGPRYSIIHDLPYDRAQTSMAKFAMCPACQAEYDNPRDRRFHAQPNACPNCGPQLAFWDQLGHILGQKEAALQGAIAAIRQGKIVAVQGLGGFHLMVDAHNETAVQVLRQRKQRPGKPLALMYPDLDAIYQDCEVSTEAEVQLTSPQAPIVLLPRRTETQLAPSIAPGHPTIGVMLPYTPLHFLLLKDLDAPVVATSGNRASEPICIDSAIALQQLAGIADYFLVHNRPIVRAVDDSVLSLAGATPLWLRRSRGYAPLPLKLAGDHQRKILAVGGHLKNTVAIAFAGQIFLSQHIGDLTNLAAFNAFQNAITDLSRMYDFQPDCIVCDAHPDYQSSQFAHRLSAELNIEVLPVQHHYAHILAVMAEQQIEVTGEPILGIAWDGTGYGLDGTIWGGEFMEITAQNWQRLAHLQPFNLPGGDKAIQQPWRIALGLLVEALGNAAWDRADLPPVRTGKATERRIVQTMLARQLNTPRTSSVGRLFDAIASLLGLCQAITYDGEAAMRLEFASTPHAMNETYPIQLRGTVGDTSLNLPLQIEVTPIILAILNDIADQIPVGQIAAKFHYTLGEIAIAVLQNLAQTHGKIYRQIVLSGGCFQNRLLLTQMRDRLTECGYQVHIAQSIPSNDGGLAVGQILAAVRQYHSTPSL